MLVLCPNHHAIFDLGWAEFVSPHAVRIGSETFPLVSKHALSAQCISYHNEKLRRV
jgi:predicted restriction endonuclease